jgi:hypothetical protein
VAGTGEVVASRGSIGGRAKRPRPGSSGCGASGQVRRRRWLGEEAVAIVEHRGGGEGQATRRRWCRQPGEKVKDGWWRRCGCDVDPNTQSGVQCRFENMRGDLVVSEPAYIYRLTNEYRRAVPHQACHHIFVGEAASLKNIIRVYSLVMWSL